MHGTLTLTMPSLEPVTITLSVSHSNICEEQEKKKEKDQYSNLWLCPRGQSKGLTSVTAQHSSRLLEVMASSVLASKSPFTVHNLISLRVHETMFPCSYHSNKRHADHTHHSMCMCAHCKLVDGDDIHRTVVTTQLTHKHQSDGVPQNTGFVLHTKTQHTLLLTKQTVLAETDL